MSKSSCFSCNNPSSKPGEKMCGSCTHWNEHIHSETAEEWGHQMEHREGWCSDVHYNDNYTSACSVGSHGKNADDNGDCKWHVTEKGTR